MKSIGQHSQHHLNRVQCSSSPNPHCSYSLYPGLHRDNLSILYWSRAQKAFRESSLLVQNGYKMYNFKRNTNLCTVKEIKCAAYTKKSNNNGNSLILSIQHSVMKEVKYKERIIRLCGESDFCHNKTLESFNQYKRPASTNTASAPNTNHSVHHNCKCSY